MEHAVTLLQDIPGIGPWTAQYVAMRALRHPDAFPQTDLVLKRGMLVDSKVIDWCLAAFRDRDFKPTDIDIILMNEKGDPLRTWNVTHAIPKKWLVTDLNANENAIVIETLELIYQYFTVK